MSNLIKTITKSASLGGSSNLTTTAVLNIQNSTASTTSSLGALVVGGGVGVGGALNIGGTINGLTITSGTIAQSAISSVSGAIVDTGTASQSITATKTFSGGLNLSGGTVNCNGATISNANITSGTIAQSAIANVSGAIVDTTSFQTIGGIKTFSGATTVTDIAVVKNTNPLNFYLNSTIGGFVENAYMQMWNYSNGTNNISLGSNVYWNSTGNTLAANATTTGWQMTMGTSNDTFQISRCSAASGVGTTFAIITPYFVIKNDGKSVLEQQLQHIL